MTSIFSYWVKDYSIMTKTKMEIWKLNIFVETKCHLQRLHFLFHISYIIFWFGGIVVSFTPISSCWKKSNTCSTRCDQQLQYSKLNGETCSIETDDLEVIFLQTSSQLMVIRWFGLMVWIPGIPL